MSGIRPVQLFDDEPHVIIFCNEPTGALYIDLQSFQSVLTIVHSMDDLRNYIARSNRLFIIIALFPSNTSQTFDAFNRIEFQPNTNVDLIYLLYKKDLEFVTTKQNRQRGLLKEWRSTTDDTREKVLFICSKAIDRNVAYHTEQAERNHTIGDNSIAALYQQQLLERCRLQKAVLRLLFSLL